MKTTITVAINPQACGLNLEHVCDSVHRQKRTDIDAKQEVPGGNAAPTGDFLRTSATQTKLNTTRRKEDEVSFENTSTILL